MKKIFMFVMTVTLAVSMLVSCGVAATQGLTIVDGALLASTLSLGETVLVDPTEGEDITFEDAIPEEENDAVAPELTIPENVVMEGIEATGEKHPFGGNDVVILTVKNTLETSYSLTATVTYYDADKNVIKTEVQTFDQYAAGYQNYFLFMPGITFEYYSFVIEGTPYDGVCYAENFTGGFSHFQVSLGNAQGADAIPGKNMRQFVVHGAMQLINKNDVEVIFSGYIVLFNNRGEIKSILYCSPRHMAPDPDGAVNGYNHWLVNKEVKETFDYYTYDEEGNLISITHSNDYLTFPEELEGELRSFMVVSSITAWAYN